METRSFDADDMSTKFLLIIDLAFFFVIERRCAPIFLSDDMLLLCLSSFFPLYRRTGQQTSCTSSRPSAEIVLLVERYRNEETENVQSELHRGQVTRPSAEQTLRATGHRSAFTSQTGTLSARIMALFRHWRSGLGAAADGARPGK